MTEGTMTEGAVTADDAGSSGAREIDGVDDVDAGERPQRVTRRRAETRRRLLDAALDVFAERGLRGATVEEVCERAGYTRGAFYSNFRTLDELMLALWEAKVEEALESLRAALLGFPADVDATPTQSAAGDTDESPDPDEVLDAAVEAFLASVPVDRRWWLVSTEFLVHAARNEEAGRALQAHRDRFTAQFVDLLTKAMQGAGRELVTPPDLAARVLIAFHDGALMQSFLDAEEAPLGRLERQAFPALLRSMSVVRR
ncbi:TetR/AcrR family transcriptional regulator [Motilibacter deserti]|uniref:Helix-turn-helix transcriptional regulator n=1 Tax=Motilibacter deserti TaxID=2714956 RepID=A0ABX0GUG4_9ACTN|nr:TetR/AcrR family transcriptional regulator [Motilibacter deserti]NHC13307.1 helix-turn-helix transcriptional regulator [Motilibacter deserti]